MAFITKPSYSFSFKSASIDKYTATILLDHLAPNNVKIGFTWEATVNVPVKEIALWGFVRGYNDRYKDPDVFALIVSFVFGVSSTQPFQANETGNIIKIPDELMITLLGVTYSTMRGILIEKLNGTKLRSLILPAVSARTLFEKNRLTPSPNVTNSGNDNNNYDQDYY